MKIHKRLCHPNIVLFLGASAEKGYLLLLMEYVEGPNLEDLLFRESDEYPVLTDKVKMKVATHIVQGVTYLHSCAVVHCDIKPANVLLSKNYDVIKLCDLGISKLRFCEQTLTTARNDILPGTPSYLAPEVLLHKAKTSKTTDIWSVGCTLLELFTGEECWSCYDTDDDSDAENDTDDTVDALRSYMKRKLPPIANIEVADEQLKCQLCNCVDYNDKLRPLAPCLGQFLKNSPC